MDPSSACIGLFTRPRVLQLRARHGAPPLKWNAELANQAQKAADECARREELEHCHCHDQGQNIFAGSAGYFGAGDAIQDWYDEITDPGYVWNSQTAHRYAGSVHCVRPPPPVQWSPILFSCLTYGFFLCVSSHCHFAGIALVLFTFSPIVPEPDGVGRLLWNSILMSGSGDGGGGGGGRILGAGL